MTGIAGIEKPRASEEVEAMLAQLHHRGAEGMEIFEQDSVTLGVVWSQSEENLVQMMQKSGYVCDIAAKGQFARAEERDGSLTLLRGKIGVVPLYYGRTAEGHLCFASEVKALLPLTDKIDELNPASFFDGNKIESYSTLSVKEPVDWGVEEIAVELRDTLVDEVKKSLKQKKSVGALLSGGLASSIIASIAHQHVDELRTYSIGLKDAGNLNAAREVAKNIKSNHSEVIVTQDDITEVLADVVYHLESFDPILVRSGIMNFIAAREAAKDVNCLLMGDGADELFGGYRHIKSMNHEAMAVEIVDLTSSLHNTILQSIDRSTAAHGLTPLLVFLTPDVVKLALRIPARYKVYKGKGNWILREAMRDYLPDKILMRAEAEPTHDIEIGKMIARLAGGSISDNEFERERELPNGWKLDTKEELLYYRIFRMHFGELEDLSWMGRMKANWKS
ncbi:MAG: asparagine synthase-related protein [Candidatus Thorarchaeota archaeon]